jgi:hypothetical protein
MAARVGNIMALYEEPEVTAKALPAISLPNN